MCFDEWCIDINSWACSAKSRKVAEDPRAVNCFIVSSVVLYEISWRLSCWTVSNLGSFECKLSDIVLGCWKIFLVLSSNQVVAEKNVVQQNPIDLSSRCGTIIDFRQPFTLAQYSYCKPTEYWLAWMLTRMMLVLQKAYCYFGASRFICSKNTVTDALGRSLGVV